MNKPIIKEGYIVYTNKDCPTTITEDIKEIENFEKFIRIDTVSGRTFFYYLNTNKWTVLHYDEKIDDVYDVDFEGIVITFKYSMYLNPYYNH